MDGESQDGYVDESTLALPKRRTDEMRCRRLTIQLASSLDLLEMI